MPSLFTYYPYVLNKVDDDRKILLTNIAKRIILRPDVVGRKILFETLSIEEGDRPDLVAYQYYGDSSLDWLIMMTNKILHPQFEWYMGYHDFKAFVAGKYGTVEDAHRTVHHYEKLMSSKDYYGNGEYTPDVWLIVDEYTYTHTPEDRRKRVTCFEYEDGINKERQRIRVVHKSFAPQIVNELRTVIKNG